jgi:hypothetical protein
VGNPQLSLARVEWAIMLGWGGNSKRCRKGSSEESKCKDCEFHDRIFRLPEDDVEEKLTVADHYFMASSLLMGAK